MVTVACYQGLAPAAAAAFLGVPQFVCHPAVSILQLLHSETVFWLMLFAADAADAAQQ